MCLKIQKTTVVDNKVFEPHSETGVYTVDFHFLQHVVEKLEKLKNLYFFSVSQI